MKREYMYILVAYIGMQLSGLVGIPALTIGGTFLGFSLANLEIYAPVIWIVFSFSVTLILVLFLLRKEMRAPFKNVAPVGVSITWAIVGIFLAFAAQGLAANIELWLGIDMGSENTQTILSIIESFPIVILISSVIGPILEEIVFRKIIFSSLHQKLNFFFSALISSIIFALAHMELDHLILYSAMGFTFAYLYKKTNRILVPITAHVMMNTFVVLIQSVFKEDIERLLQEMDKVQSFIGGL